MLCPCGSQQSYAKCCELLHLGAAAPSPEALMRSRYSAFALNNTDYLLKSWHSSTRPKELELDADDSWLRLEVFSSASQGKLGQVSFAAYFKTLNESYVLSEVSNFIREKGHWFYVDGLPECRELK